MESDLPSPAPAAPFADEPAHDPRVPGGATLIQRMREAAGTVYGDIGTSVLYTTMEITRDTVHLKHPELSHEQRAAIAERCLILP